MAWIRSVQIRVAPLTGGWPVAHDPMHPGYGLSNSLVESIGKEAYDARNHILGKEESKVKPLPWLLLVLLAALPLCAKPKVDVQV